MIDLRPWQESDLPLLERATRDDYVAMIVHLPVPFAREDALAWIAGRPATDFAVVAGSEPVGGAGFTPRHVPGLVEVGYWVVDGRRGAGIATQALELVVQRALDAGTERVQAVVEPWNAASQRVLEKAGFEREGLLRGYARYGDEPRRDVYLYARLT